jgi:hypothetical protein
MKRSKRETRSDKFPLTLHPTGQYWSKSIFAKLRYYLTNQLMVVRVKIIQNNMIFFDL